MKAALQDMTVWIWLVGILAIIALAFYLVFRWLNRLASRDYLAADDERQIRDEVNNLPLSVACEEAQRLIHDQSKFILVVRSVSIPQSIENRLGKQLKDFFSAAKSLNSLFDDLRLELQEPPEWARDKQYLVIGSIAENTMLLVREGQDPIFEWDTDIPEDLLSTKDQLKSLGTPEYPSVNHLIVMVHREWVQRHAK